MSNFSRVNTTRLYTAKPYKPANFGLESLLEHKDILAGLGGAGAGALAGASTGDDSDRVSRALIGAATGGAAGYGGAKGIKYLRGAAKDTKALDSGLGKGLGEGIARDAEDEGKGGNWIGKTVAGLAGLTGLGGAGKVAYDNKQNIRELSSVLPDVIQGKASELASNAHPYIQKAQSLLDSGKIQISQAITALAHKLGISKEEAAKYISGSNKWGIISGKDGVHDASAGASDLLDQFNASRYMNSTANFFINPMTIGAGIGGLGGALTANPNATLGDRLGRGVAGAALGAGAGAAGHYGYNALKGAGGEAVQQAANTVKNAGNTAGAVVAGAGAIGAGAGTHLDQIGEGAKNLFYNGKDHAEKLSQGINKWGTDKLDQVKSLFNGKTPPNEEEVAGLKNELGDHFNVFAQAALNHVNNLGSHVSNIINGGKAVIGDVANSAGQAIQGGVDQVFQPSIPGLQYSKDTIAKANFYSNPIYMAEFSSNRKSVNDRKYYRRGS